MASQVEQQTQNQNESGQQQQQQQPRKGGGGNNQSRKIFIGGLNYNTTEDGLKQHFGQYGNIVDVVVMKFPDTKRSRGFGFITYELDEQVDACQEARPHVIDGKQVETKRATPREAFGQPEAGQTVKKIFIGGLKEETTDEEMREYFSQFGDVTSVTRLTEKDTGKKRGFGFVEFDDYDPVDKCMQKSYHELSGRKVDVKKAISKQEINQMGGPRAVKLNGPGSGGGGGPRGGRMGGRGGGGGGRDRGGRFGGGRGGGQRFNQSGSGGGWGNSGSGYNGGGGGGDWGPVGDHHQGQGGGGGRWNTQASDGWGNNSGMNNAVWGNNVGNQGGWGNDNGNGGWATDQAGGGFDNSGYGNYGSNNQQQGYGGGPVRNSAAGGFRSNPYGGQGGGGGGFRGGRGRGGFR